MALSPTAKPQHLPSSPDFAVPTEEGAIDLEILLNTPAVFYTNRDTINRVIAKKKSKDKINTPQMRELSPEKRSRCRKGVR